MKSLMEWLLEAGYPRDQMFNHESDLYVFKTSLTTKVVVDWCEENNFNQHRLCPVFKDQVTGKLMYNCVFQYNPWREEKLSK